MNSTAQKFDLQEAPLKTYAQRWQDSKGRTHDEPLADDRTPYQRDRDRVMFSDAFRRLQYKRQVFMNTEEGDFRTRLTHTLEVAQLSRSVCRNLGLDESLGETCALAHDIGHPPFGHAGEDALNDCMENFGGFDHNIQAMRILQKLESPYVAFDGLNLTWETVEGIAKHNGPIMGDVAENPLFSFLEPARQTSLEAQVGAECDEFDYKHHDLDDGLSTEKLHLDDVMEIMAFRRAWEEVNATYPRAPRDRLVKETIRRMVKRQVRDLLTATQSRIHQSGVQTAEDVRAHKEMLVGFSESMEAEGKELKSFLMENLYRHTSVNRIIFRRIKWCAHYLKPL